MIMAAILLIVSLFNFYYYVIRQKKYQERVNVLLYFAIISILATLITGVSQVSPRMDPCNLLITLPLWWVRWLNYLIAVC